MALRIVPIDFKRASWFVLHHHRHHVPPRGHKFVIACAEGALYAGVVIVGRPVSRHVDDGRTLEVTRLCTNGHRNACSMLYAAAWRAARAMGYERLITYILDTEPGTSLRAAGWKLIGETKGGTWSRTGRERSDAHPTGRKQRYEIAA